MTFSNKVIGIVGWVIAFVVILIGVNVWANCTTKWCTVNYEQKPLPVEDHRSDAHKDCEAAGGFYSDGFFGNQCIFK